MWFLITWAQTLRRNHQSRGASTVPRFHLQILSLAPNFISVSVSSLLFLWTLSLPEKWNHVPRESYIQLPLQSTHGEYSKAAEAGDAYILLENSACVSHSSLRFSFLLAASFVSKLPGDPHDVQKDSLLTLCYAGLDFFFTESVCCICYGTPSYSLCFII